MRTVFDYYLAWVEDDMDLRHYVSSETSQATTERNEAYRYDTADRAFRGAEHIANSDALKGSAEYFGVTHVVEKEAETRFEPGVTKFSAS